MLKEFPYRFDKLPKFCFAHDFDIIVSKRRSTLHFMRRMNNESFHFTSTVMSIKPSIRSIHLLGFAFVDFSSRYINFILALPQQIVYIVKSPKIIWSFFPFFIRSFSNKTKCYA